MTEPKTWQNIVEASDYTGQPVKKLRSAVGGNRLRHIRSGRGGKLSFNRQWLDDYMLSLESDDTDPQAVSA